LISDQPAAVLTTCDQSGRGLTVEFRHENDRITHRVVGTDLDGDSVTLMESVQGDFHLAWPCSPVLQGLNVNDLRQDDPAIDNQHSAAMLIGTAGDGHWSLTIEPCSDASKVGLAFDVACRVRSLPPRLTSCYRVSETVKTSETASGLQMSCHLGEFLLQALRVEPQSDQQICHMGIEEASVQIVRETSLSDSPPVTLRWRYGVWMT
jgi:hypothetical protein